jgi:hypothetical protein
MGLVPRFGLVKSRFCRTKKQPQVSGIEKGHDIVRVSLIVQNYLVRPSLRTRAAARVNVDNSIGLHSRGATSPPSPGPGAAEAKFKLRQVCPTNLSHCRGAPQKTVPNLCHTWLKIGTAEVVHGPAFCFHSDVRIPSIMARETCPVTAITVESDAWDSASLRMSFRNDSYFARA